MLSLKRTMERLNHW